MLITSEVENYQMEFRVITPTTSDWDDVLPAIPSVSEPADGADDGQDSGSTSGSNQTPLCRSRCIHRQPDRFSQ